MKTDTQNLIDQFKALADPVRLRLIALCSQGECSVTELTGIDVTCEYCGRRRRFDSVDITRVFAENVVTGPEGIQ